MKRSFILAHPQARALALECVKTAPNGFAVTVGEPSRSVEQNAVQWPILQAFADQLQWPVNSRMVSMSPDEWKDVLTAAFRKEQARLAMGLDGGVVMLGSKTSQFSKSQFSDWLEFLQSVAADRGVVVYQEDAHEI